MTNPIFLLVLMLLSTFLVSKTVGSPSYSKDSSGLLDDVVGSSRRTHRPVASTSRPPKAKSWVVADANTYEEFLSMGNDHGEGFSQRNSGRMKYTRTFTIEERAGFSFPDESQKDSHLKDQWNKLYKEEEPELAPPVGQDYDDTSNDGLQAQLPATPPPSTSSLTSCTAPTGLLACPQPPPLTARCPPAPLACPPHLHRTACSPPHHLPTPPPTRCSPHRPQPPPPASLRHHHALAPVACPTRLPDPPPPAARPPTGLPAPPPHFHLLHHLPAPPPPVARPTGLNLLHPPPCTATTRSPAPPTRLPSPPPLFACPTGLPAPPPPVARPPHLLLTPPASLSCPHLVAPNVCSPHRPPCSARTGRRPRPCVAHPTCLPALPLHGHPTGHPELPPPGCPLTTPASLSCPHPLLAPPATLSCPRPLWPAPTGCLPPPPALVPLPPHVLLAPPPPSRPHRSLAPPAALRCPCQVASPPPWPSPTCCLPHPPPCPATTSTRLCRYHHTRWAASTQAPSTPSRSVLQKP
ncbi:hypothetical protein PCASD_20354 [Puccinia coronata f. sp. avenae]|uniref:Cathepsin propeptide inhibitor domain-containing protein n=1 Tax=Puccinia coronata f. sp. avenae TaxID=200324 RepID=A0A2N5S590_9BASI|nr:hypothetical protein PCASD_20354 [Puccinia coronata f. sp. avenae]